MRSKGTSSKPQSNLVRRFVERSGADPERSSPEEAMAEVIERSRGRQTRNHDQQLQQVLKDRNVVAVEFVGDLSSDGMLEPIGQAFSDGFRMRLKKNASSERVRFTMAHELCHTFFYELVPEMKFKIHATDAAEEHLCNFGAAALLIPAASLRKKSKKEAICLDSLGQLARGYAVSLPTMLLRLRSLGLWKCQLSQWHRTVSGDFVLDRLYGGPQVDWQWEDASLLKRVWESSAPAYGSSFVYVECNNGTRRYKPIRYNVERLGNGAIALWGTGISPRKLDHPLLNAARPTRTAAN
jgi:Zn-dependent peptidase ImmA (M78 family)